jgi:hypothetical protein
MVTIESVRLREVPVEVVVERCREVPVEVVVERCREVPVRVVVEWWLASGMPTTVDSCIAEVLVPVKRKRGLAARTPERNDTDKGRSNMADSNTDTDGNSREDNRPGRF